MPTIDNPFDRTKNYRKLSVPDSSLLYGKDLNHTESILRDAFEQMGMGLTGWSIVFTGDLGGTLGCRVLCDLRVNDQIYLEEGGLGNGGYSFNLIDATHIKWRLNLGVWDDNGGPGYLVVNDGTTWNSDVGGSGFDLLVSANGVIACSETFIASRGLRLGGGELTATGVPNQLRINEGHWIFHNKWVDLPSTILNVVNDDDYIYVGITESVIDYTADTDLVHRLPDSRKHPIAPEATKVTYTLGNAQLAAVPLDTTSATYIIIGRVSVDGGGNVTPYQVWESPLDLQKVWRDITGPVQSLDCEIALGDPGPTFSLIDVDQFEGFKINVTAVPTHTDSVKIWMDDGAPPVLSDAFLYDVIPCPSPREIFVSHHEGVDVHVTLKGVDDAGAVQANSTTHNIDIGAVSQIAAGDPGPTFALSKINGFEGFKLDITGVPANTASVKIWTREGAPPALTDFYLWREVPCTIAGGNRIFYISYFEGDTAHVTLKAVDEYGVAQVNATAHSLDLERWLEGTFIVAKSGADFSTISNAITEIHAKALTRATIHVMPGQYDESISFPAGWATYLTIRGFGQAAIEGANIVINLDNMVGHTAIPALTGEMPDKYFSLKFESISISGTIERSCQVVGGATQWGVLFVGCDISFDGAVSTDPLFDIDQDQSGGAGVWVLLRCRDCHIYDNDTKTSMFNFGDGAAGANTTEVYWQFFDCSIVGTKSQYIIHMESSNLVGQGVRLVGGCRLQGTTAPASCIFYLGALGTGDALPQIDMHGSAWYCTILKGEAAGTLTVDAGTNDTNTEFSTAFLRRSK